MQHALALKEKYEHVFFPDLVWPFFMSAYIPS